ncbi:MAG: M15 family metallopeptidase [Treponema sp.]|nr:M15 family metallopeptidase [Treponema sp.]
MARLSYADTFDVRKNDTFPDAKKYDAFLVGVNTANGADNETLKAFLAGFDFWDATVIPFWLGGIESPGNAAGIETMIQGAWLLMRGQEFRYGRDVKLKEVNSLAAEWMDGLRAELAARKAVGEGAGEVVKAFAAAFSDRIAEPEFRFSAVDGRGDWYFTLDGIPYAYASGRFLPADEAERREDFRPVPVYRYRRQADDPEVEDHWNTLASRIKSRRSGGALSGWNRGSVNPDTERSPFYETLYACRTREEAYQQQEWITFLNRRVQVHKAIKAPLARVETQIFEREKSDAAITEWRKRLYSITSWNWRNVAGSGNRSYHSYGIAIDLLETQQPGKETYWQWTRAKGVNWRTVTADQRLDPPDSVISAFEEQGFIWGGTWPWYDTMHFEYRPELLIVGS